MTLQMPDSVQTKFDQNDSIDHGEVEISDTDDFFDSADNEEAKKAVEKTPEPPKKPKHVKNKCPKCPKLFYKAHLKRHMKSAHAYKRTFSCTLYKCGKGFTTKKKLEHHVTFDHEESINVPGDKKCPYCKTEFKSSVDYKYHVQRNHTHYCEECPLRFAKKKKLEEHVLKAHQKDIRLDKTCHKCGSVQRGLTDYYRHIAYEHNWECEHCELRFAQKQKLEEHVLKVHNLDIKLDKTCKLCEQQIRSLSDFRTHILRDHKYVCTLEECHLKFACKSKLEEHCLTAHQTNIKVDRTCPKCQNVIRGLNDYFRHVEKDHRFACSMCTLKFAYKLKFEEHLLQAHGEQARTTKTCLHCLTTLESLPDYNDHISLEHNFSCICNLKFTSKASLEQHRIAEHGTSIPPSPASNAPLTCQLCLLTFTSASKMSKHQHMEHKFVCHEQDCDTKFVSRVKLDEHTENVHQKSLDHSRHKMCLVCGQHFTRPENLRKHRRNPHVYQCEHCTKIFTTMDKKEQHSMIVHKIGVSAVQSIPTEYLNICHLCEKSFKKPYLLRNHMDLEHKFHCTECDKRFTMKHVLRDHKKNIHNLESEMKSILSCETCDNTYLDHGSFRRHMKIDHLVCCIFCDKKFTKEKYLDLHVQIFHAEDQYFSQAKLEKMIPHLISIDSIYESLNFVKNHAIEEEEEEEIECPFDEEVYDQIDAGYDSFTQALYEPQVEIEETPI